MLVTTRAAEKASMVSDPHTAHVIQAWLGSVRAVSSAYGGAMLWRRYRVGMIAAIPVGIAIGIGVGFLASRAYVGWGSSDTPFLVSGGVLGGIDAAAALVGTVVAMQLRFRSAGREAGRVGSAALGAGLGAVAPWIVIGVLLGTSGLLALFLSLMAAAVCAPVSAGLAALTVRAADRSVRV